jgi:hypothetical protein
MPKIVAEKKTKAGVLLRVIYPGDKKGKWVWKNKLPPESLSAWQEHLSR